MRFLSYFVFAAMLGIGFAAESESPKPTGAPKGQAGQPHLPSISLSEECSKTIVKLCSKLTEKKLSKCEKKYEGSQSEIEKCIMKAMGTRADVDRCEAENLDFLIKKGCEHLECKRLSRDKCGCSAYPQKAEDFICWHQCYHRNVEEYKKHKCDRPPMLAD